MGLGSAATNNVTGSGSPIISDQESRGIRTTTGSTSALSTTNIQSQSSTVSSPMNQSSPGLHHLQHHHHQNHHIHQQTKQQQHHQHGTSPTSLTSTTMTSTTTNPDQTSSAVSCDESLTAAFGQAAVAAAASQLFDIKDVINASSNGGGIISCDQQLNGRFSHINNLR